MGRVIAILVSGFALAACSMSMPSLDMFKSTPATEVLRVESEPPGADVRTTEGQSCRTPCELTVTGANELTVTFALNGYQPQTIAVRSGASSRLQPNPVFAELQAVPAPAKKKQVVQRRPAKKKSSEPATNNTPAPPPSNPSGFPWPDPPR